MDKDEFSRRARDATQSLYRVACAYLASPPDRDDAVQEALLRAWEKRRTLREEQYFKTWLTRILIRVCVDMQRRKKRVIVSDNLPEQVAPEPPDPLLRVPQGTVKSRLSRARRQLQSFLKEDTAL